MTVAKTNEAYAVCHRVALVAHSEAPCYVHARPDKTVTLSYLMDAMHPIRDAACRGSGRAGPKAERENPDR